MGVSTFFPAEVMTQAHRELVVTLTPPPAPLLEIIVIKRTLRRELAQHDELLLALAQAFPGHRVRVFTAEGHVREHAQLFYNAAAVIAPHGAGLRNIIFSRPGTAVLEIGYSCSAVADHPSELQAPKLSALLGGCWFETSYHSMATALGHRYGLLLGLGVMFDQMSIGNNFHQISVAVEEVVTLLQQLLHP